MSDRHRRWAELNPKSFTHPLWARQTKHRDLLNLWSANNQPISSKGVILLHFQEADLRIHMLLGVAEDLTVNLLLGTSLLYRYV